MTYATDNQMRKSTALLILAGLLVVGTGRAADWTLDDAESRLEFVADYTGSELSGQFRRFGVELDFDADAPAAGRLAVSVDMLSADMGDDDMTGAVIRHGVARRAGFLDCDVYERHVRAARRR